MLCAGVQSGMQNRFPSTVWFSDVSWSINIQERSKRGKTAKTWKYYAKIFRNDLKMIWALEADPAIWYSVGCDKCFLPASSWDSSPLDFLLCFAFNCSVYFLDFQDFVKKAHLRNLVSMLYMFFFSMTCFILSNSYQLCFYVLDAYLNGKPRQSL